MLRHFSQQPSLDLLKDVLTQFDNPVPKKQITLVEFQILSPDSFRWRLLLDGVVYYLYAEDHVVSLKDVHKKISSWFASTVKIDFIRTKQQENFANTPPFNSAAIYEEPSDYDQMRFYAASSGYDFVFLCKSDEDPSSALFNS